MAIIQGWYTKKSFHNYKAIMSWTLLFLVISGVSPILLAKLTTYLLYWTWNARQISGATMAYCVVKSEHMHIYKSQLALYGDSWIIPPLWLISIQLKIVFKLVTVLDTTIFMYGYCKEHLLKNVRGWIQDYQLLEKQNVFYNPHLGYIDLV